MTTSPQQEAEGLSLQKRNPRCSRLGDDTGTGQRDGQIDDKANTAKNPNGGSLGVDSYKR